MAKNGYVSQFCSASTCYSYSIATLLKPITFEIDYSKKYVLLDSDTFGARIRKLRKLENLTATELGNKINIHPDSLKFIEREQFNPTYENIHKLYSYFGCKIIVDSYSKYIIEKLHLKLKQYRNNNKLSKKDMAEFFCVSAMTYRKLERTSDITKRLFNKLKPQLIKLGIFNED